MEIKVLFHACPLCEKALAVVKEAVAESGLDVTVEKVTGIREVLRHGMAMMPAVVVDGEVKSAGCVPKRVDVRGWIASTEEALC